MKRNKKLQLIKQIKNDTTISKITRRKLRKKLMSGMQAGLEEVGKYVIRINYLNSDKNKPYVSICGSGMIIIE